MLAGILAALCLWFSWRALRRCRAIHGGTLQAELEDDPLELRLAERELNLELNLAGRIVKGLGRTSLFGGTGLAIWSYATGAFATQPVLTFASFALGLAGWGGCREFHRRIGSLADSWRSETNRRRRRQGVDQSAATG
ncbi:MAG TPA: hypothetical protein VHB79_14020 [Polyangiaceae bacterium]|nr:hypothetical protein [Polyangiaceae bacterium]